ncbi:HlyD family secretion protein [Natronincola peptidivorans]|uniref:HlyD family secretion protein n=1 Tax=Natronincola peptidivorans TaxID=426128 RepID=UPI001FCAF229|nr:efflux RND transporter periplasmic adaptor subunit [Natronincola peptidivorans]
MIATRNIILVLLVISLAFIVTGCSGNGEETHVEEVDLSQELKTVEAFGLVKAEETKNIIIDFPATVEEIFVKEGQQISFQDPIFTLDFPQYVSEIFNKENELMIAGLEKQKIEKNLQGLYRENRELEIEKLTNDLSFAQTVYDQYLSELQGHEKLHTAGAISQQEFDKIRREVEEKKKLVDDIDYQLQEAKYKKEQFLLKQEAENDQLRIQKERVAQVENQLALMKDKLNKAYMKENQVVCQYQDAVIYDIQYALGDIVDPTLKAFTIASLDSLIIEANIVEEFIRDVEIGASAKIIPVADRGRDYTGKVVSISNMAFQINGETVIPIRISVENTDHFLMPNYNVDVFIDLQ